LFEGFDEFERLDLFEGFEGFDWMLSLGLCAMSKDNFEANLWHKPIVEYLFFRG
jgi:hypothetical protein